MALPKWITPAGQLGIVPELDYYEFPLDAYDATGGLLYFSKVSGRLPLGLQVVSPTEYTLNVSANVTVYSGSYITQASSGANAQVVLDDTISSTQITVRYVNPIAFDLAGELSFDGVTSTVIPSSITPPAGPRLQGIPVSELAGENNVEYTFTIRAQNVWSGGLADRTFNIIITNVAPPVISAPTRNSYLGLYLDGTEVSLQLAATEAVPSATLEWSLKKGELPDGLSLSSTGLISGYVHPIPDPAPGTDEGWDQSPWSYLGWDFPLKAISKTFTFTVELFDGVNYDLSTYTLKVYPRSSLTADNDELPVDTDSLESGIGLTIDYGSKHNPIISTLQSDLVPVRQGSYFSFNVDAIDLDGDILNYSVPSLASGAFDEQVIAGNSIPYIAATTISNRLYAGVYPSASAYTTALDDGFSFSTKDYVNVNLRPDDDIKVLDSNNLWHDAIVNDSTSIRLTGSSLFNANVGEYITQEITGANAEITAVSDTTGLMAVSGSVLTGYINTTGTLPAYNITFSGDLTANVGDFITQGAANATVTANVVASTVVPVLYTAGTFSNSSGNVSVNGITTGVHPTANVKIPNTILVSANVGDFITQGSANATVTADVVNGITIPVVFKSGTFTTGSGNLAINGTPVSVYPSGIIRIPVPTTITANVGDYITQGAANAVITSSVVSALTVPVEYLTGTFTTGSGNIAINGTTVLAYPDTVVCNTDVTATYVDITKTFDVATSNVLINNASTNSNVSSILSVGVTLGSLSTEGVSGFDETKFDQGTLSLPTGLTIDLETGWITGQLPTQTINQIDYQFEIIVYKRDDGTYQDSQLYTLTVLGDLNNRIEWITPANLGTIENGNVSDLLVIAQHTNTVQPKTLIYSLKSGAANRLPQGLVLTSTGLISGRVSFEIFTLDQGFTTLDSGNTTFDNTYTFTVTARDLDNSVSADRTFTVRVLTRNNKPYEDLYLKALPDIDQRDQFNSIMRDTTIFPHELIYRLEDPYFGIAKDIRSLFLAGLDPSTLADYVAAASTNHFTKRFLFNSIKTAQVLDENFNVKYEVVYLQLDSENDIEATSFANIEEVGPQDTIDLTNIIDTPYYDVDGNPYTVAYPNSTQNMEHMIVNNIGYANKGALPNWMTSRQADGRVLGFIHAVVLAYTKPDASALIAYRLRERNFNFNTIEFTVDRYQIDNKYSENYDITAGAFLTSAETTFDRYPGLSSLFVDQGVVDYAVSISFESINNRLRSELITRSLIPGDADNGLDGIKSFKDGQTLVFAQQEFRRDQNDIGDYNQGWSDVSTLWDGDAWDWDLNTAPLTDDLGWDAASYVPGYNEHNFNSAVPNQRAGVWQINIDSDDIVTLTFLYEINIYEKVYVRYGYTYGSTNIYFDPIVKVGNTVPNYSIIQQQIRTQYTTFDGNGTRFFDYRDEYTVPESGDKYIKFTKTGVFT